MMSPEHAQLLARYNEWQNRSLCAAANSLTDEARRADRGAFFSSIHCTFSHVIWADMIWLHRFAGTLKPEGTIKSSPAFVEEWSALKAARVALDASMIEWTQTLDAAWLAGDLTWFSGAAGKELSRPRWLLVAHMFNHQTHHRGQIHAMLTAAGAKPEDTDLMLMESGS